MHKCIYVGNRSSSLICTRAYSLETDLLPDRYAQVPFLPYRNENGTLLFPTGEFVGVYYSEELKYAREIGYTVIPISGYLFEKKENPFWDFVSDLFESRLETKKSGNVALSYVYKILMNSLYSETSLLPDMHKCIYVGD